MLYYDEYDIIVHSNQNFHTKLVIKLSQLEKGKINCCNKLNSFF